MSYYDVLGVETTASQAEITTAYRKLALKFHPDRVPAEKKDAAKEKFQEISNAYEILRDPDLRKKYDLGCDPKPTIDPEELFNKEFAEVIAAVAAEIRNQAPEGDRTWPSLSWGAAGAAVGYCAGAILCPPAILSYTFAGVVIGVVQGYTGKNAIDVYQKLSPQTRQRLLDMIEKHGK